MIISSATRTSSSSEALGRESGILALAASGTGLVSDTWRLLEYHVVKMENAVSVKPRDLPDPSGQIDQLIAEITDWRGKMLARVARFGVAAVRDSGFPLIPRGALVCFDKH